MMDHLFSSLVDYLQLVDAYNIFILNPRHDAKKVNYGYRSVPLKDFSLREVADIEIFV